MNTKIIIENLKKVFSRAEYLIITFIFAVLLYSLNVIIASWRSLFSFYNSAGFSQALQLFLDLFFGMYKTVKFSSFVSLVIISVLFGILLSLLLYKKNLGMNDKKLGAMGFFGFFLGIFAPGCMACGFGVISALGLSAGIVSLFPYEGLELSILAIIILILAIFHTTKALNTCPNVNKHYINKK